MKLNLGFDKIITYLLALFFFVLPWQTRWIWHWGELGGGFWEYGSKCVYGTEILLWVIFVFFIIKRLRDTNIRMSLLKYCYIAILLYCFVFFEISNQTIFHRIEGLLLIFVIFELAKKQYNNITIYLTSLWLGGVAQGILGIWQFFTQNVFASKWLGLASHSAFEGGANVIEFAGGRWLRAYGSLGGANPLGIYLAVALVVGLFFFFKTKKQYSLPLLNATARQGNIAILVGQSLIFVGLLLTFSRGAWLAALVGILSFVFFIGKENFKKLLPILGMFVTVILIIVGLLWPLFSTRFGFSVRLEQQSVIERVSQISDWQQIFHGNWLWGVGSGNYTFALFQLHPSLPYWQLQPVHNAYLLILAENGVVVLLCCFVVMLLWFRWLYKNNRLFLPVVLTLLVSGLFEHWSVSLFPGIMFFAAVVGLSLISKEQKGF